MNISESKKAKRINSFSAVGIFSLSFLMASSAVYVFAPIIGSHADVVLNADVNVNIGSVASLTLDKSAATLNLAPYNTATDALNATIYTNSPTGYTLAIEDFDTSANMVHASSNINDVFTSTFEGGKTLSEMSDNTWGFSTNTISFKKVPTRGNSTTVKRSTSKLPNGNDTAAITFGAKAGSIASGAYTDKVLFTLYANGQTDYCDDGIFCISTMQEMTPAVCAATTTPLATATTLDWDGSHAGDNNYVPRTILTDTRDDNTYLVSKLADGNCWMSQNLAFDLVADTPFEASNINGSFTTATPDHTTNTDYGSFEYRTDSWFSYHPKAEESYVQAGSTMTSEPSGTGHEYDWEKTGNYYNWFAATAGSGIMALTSEDAPLSICPRGWKLPTSLEGKSFYNLAGAYNVQSSSEGVAALRSSPFNFISAGTVWYTPGNIHDYNRQIMLWSSTQNIDSFYGASTIRAFNAESFTVQPRATTDRSYGLNVRCVAI